jgi:acyl carrier protein
MQQQLRNTDTVSITNDIATLLERGGHTLAWEAISAHHKLVDDLGMDSLDTLEVLHDVEEFYGISDLEEHADKLHTVGDIINAVEKALAVCHS